MLVGYVRVSTADQNLDRQLNGIELDRLYEEKLSGKTRERPKLKECMDSLKEGDTLHVLSMSEVATNNKSLLKFLLHAKSIHVNVVFVSDGVTVLIGDDLHIFEVMRAFEVSAEKERQRIGIDKAIKNGVKFGKPSIDDSKKIEIKERRLNGESISSIAKTMGVCTNTVFKYRK